MTRKELNPELTPPGVSPEKSKLLLLNSEESSHWKIMNDNVMGGSSVAHHRKTVSDTIHFYGKVSLEHNGGFASLRSPIKTFDLSGFDSLSLKCKGDGKTYGVSFSVTTYFTGYFYTIRFKTKPNKWEIFKLPFSEFRLRYFGNEIRYPSPLVPSLIKEVAVIIGDKQPGDFSLEIDWLTASQLDG